MTWLNLNLTSNLIQVSEFKFIQLLLLQWSATYRNFFFFSDEGWGFCSKECYPDQTQPFFGVAREKAIDVLDENYCEQQLTNNGAKKFKAKISTHNSNLLQ